jgi:N-acetylmuramoyl-L-alanine amidase
LHSHLAWIIAFLVASPAVQAGVGITYITCTRAGTQASVRFEANGPLSDYQKPELIGGNAVLRFVNIVMNSDATIDTCDGVTITHEQIREFLVMRIDAGGLGKVSVRRDGPRAVVMTISGLRMADPEPPAQTDNEHSGQWALDVVVIDAGHGGKDVGAKGVNGVFEKDVTLAIARRLRALVQEHMPETKVVMTRDDDTFVELYRRTQIANEAKGKLFVSIHCNSMPTIPHPANGCETYILRPGRNEDAARVAERENASVQLEGGTHKYAGLDADQLIVATMAQRSFVRFSEELAANIQNRVASSTGLANRGVNQAGFFVLVGASMPNILFETAFLSNANDASYISSAKGQKEVATAMLAAIKDYAVMYQTSLAK